MLINYEMNIEMLAEIIALSTLAQRKITKNATNINFGGTLQETRNIFTIFFAQHRYLNIPSTRDMYTFHNKF